MVELDAPHRLAYLWHSEEESLPTLVTWTLEPVEAGTRLRVEHIGPNGIQNSIKSTSHSVPLFIDRSLAVVRCIGRPITHAHATRAAQAQKLARKEVSQCTR